MCWARISDPGCIKASPGFLFSNFKLGECFLPLDKGRGVDWLDLESCLEYSHGRLRLIGTHVDLLWVVGIAGVCLWSKSIVCEMA